MDITAVLGWGSLVWDPRTLPIQRTWFSDGPFIQVELLRKSANGRITFVLDGSALPVRSLWAVMDTTDEQKAIEGLRDREGIFKSNVKEHIGVWNKGDPTPACMLDLASWAEARSVTRVIWTKLPRKYNDLEEPASAEQISTYLAALTGRLREDAERYIRCAPGQIDTAYRRRIEAALGWTPLSTLASEK